MGRYISCGIATQIIVYGKGCLQKNKKDLLRRIDKVFNLKYYEEGLSDNDDCICLYLKEDLFNKNFKNLLLELNDLDLFTNYFYDNIKAISSNSYNMSQKDRKKAVCDYLEKNFDLKITRSYEKRVDGKNNYDYYLDNVLELNDEISFFYENYLNCTDIGDGAQFNDNITNINGLYMSLNHIPLYFDFNKIISEDITVTLKFLNHFIRKSLKNDLKNTCLYYTNRYLLISLRVEVEILTVYLKNLLLSVFINKWGGGISWLCQEILSTNRSFSTTNLLGVISFLSCSFAAYSS